MRLPDQKLDQILDRFDQIEARLGAASDGEEIVRLSREHSELKEVTEKARELKAARASLAEAEAIIAEGGDKDMAELAQEERAEMKERIPQIERELQLLLLPKDKDDDANIIIEVRAGTGGDEAALFAGDLFRMYERHAAKQGWKVEVISASESEVGGYKEVIASVTGAGVFGKLKFESGVHRVQRVPETEAGGRIHTSAATVAVLPEAEEVEIDIPAEDIRIDAMGSVTAVKRGTASADRPRVMIAAHMDEIGFMVTGIDGNGLIRFTNVGGVDPRILPGLRVKVGDDLIPGVIIWTPIHMNREQNVVKISSLRIDIGATSNGSANGKVKRGDRVAFHGRIERIGWHQILVTELGRGNRILQLTRTGNNENPSWGPDGRHLVFTTGPGRGAATELRIVDAVTGTSRTLVSGMDVKYPAWSPSLAGIYGNVEEDR